MNKIIFGFLIIVIMATNSIAIDSGKYRCGSRNLVLKDNGRAIWLGQRGFWNNYGDEAVVLNKGWSFLDKGNGKYRFNYTWNNSPAVTYCAKITKKFLAREAKNREKRLKEEEREKRLKEEEREEIYQAQIKKQNKAKQIKKEQMIKEKSIQLSIAKQFGLSALPSDIFIDISTKLLWQDVKNNKRVEKRSSLSGDTTAHVTYCEKLSLNGLTKWRLPTKNELLKIYDKKRQFKEELRSSYWSSTVHENGQINIVDFQYRHVVLGGMASDGNEYSVLCVKELEEVRIKREKKILEADKKHRLNQIKILKSLGFTSFPEDILLDTNTGLIWQDTSKVAKKWIGWKDTFKYCKNLSISGFSNWRLPTQDELVIFLNKRPKFKSTDSHYTKYWSSTVDFDSTRYKKFYMVVPNSSRKREIINFETHRLGKDRLKEYTAHIRCVGGNGK